MSVRTSLATVALLVALATMLSGCRADGIPRPATVESLVGTWSLGDAFDSPEQPYVFFARDGSWNASDGCNRVQGEWSLEPDGAISVTSGPLTGSVCEGAPIPEAVLSARRLDTQGDVLVIHGSPTVGVTELVRSRDPLVGPSRLPVGYWEQDGSARSPYLFLSSKGSFSGSDGCNTLTGPWEMTDDGAIRFPATVATQVRCEGVDTWLREATLGRAIGGVMTLESTDGTILGQLTARR